MLDMHAYRFDTTVVEADAEDLQSHLAKAYRGKIRPLCNCRDPEPGIPMYIAQFDGRFLIKRMPGTAGQHKLGCDSHELPPELSGRGAVVGQAVQDGGDEGPTTLRLDFSMSKSSGRTAPEASGKESDTVRTDGTKLTLRGLLHYLWEEAGLNRWSPAMAGKRSWYVVRRALSEALHGKTAKKAPLAQQVFVAEPWSKERDAELTARRIAAMAELMKPGKTRAMMIVIGEVKDIVPSRFGMKLILKHLPSFPFMMDTDLHRRFEKRFANAIGLWDSVDDARLVVIGTFFLGPTGIASLATLSAMVVTGNWIPFEDAYDKMIVDALSADERRFIKSLRYNLADDQALASCVLTDTVEPIALYVATPGAAPSARAALEGLIADSEIDGWLWEAGEPMPILPSPKYTRQARLALPAPTKAAGADE
ncbi:DUF1173 domain-containing protein [Burkholderia cenocepacia]|nr:DUF1173 domain-containing protein [Burkholderia cenocepacia]MBR8494710.1 DUF1173 domain-containing protein [Burkholderia cenocepacia]